MQKAHQAEALAAVRTEHKPYFDALAKHPRMLVGVEVPSTRAAGETELLRDEADAASWQEAVKVLLRDEVVTRTEATMADQAVFMDSVHNTIELFQKNHDIVPGSVTFDRVLADRFVHFAAPYELRVDGKLHGYTIPVQPLLDAVRAQLVEERQKTPATPAPPATPTPAAPAAPAAPVDPPQAGIVSKPGSSSDPEEDFSTLFGTLGLPDLQF